MASSPAAGAPTATTQRSTPEIDAEVDKFKKLQADLAKMITSQTTLASQLNENLMVKEELDRAAPEQGVYKLVGPILAKQDVDEAKTDVQRRIDFIRGELERVEKAVTDSQLQQEEIRKKVVAMRAALAPPAAA